jgi:integrase/recombinase XerD
MVSDAALPDFAAYQKALRLAANTITNRHHILTHLAHRTGRPLLELTTADLRKHLGRDGIKIGTARTERSAIVAFYTYAHSEGLIDVDPSARLAPIRLPKAKPRPFTREQIDAMLTTGAYRKTRAMILLGYYQGFRVSSIAAVHGHDIDLLSGTIRSIVKGSKPLVFPLHPVIAELAKTMPADDYWFPARGGKSGHILPASVSDQIHDAKVRAGIRDPQLTAHSLRHSFGTDLVEAGVDIRVIAELMGHESVATTQIYTEVSAERKRSGLHALEGGKVPVRSGRRTLDAA